jgi:hypothetical protein
MSQSKVLKIYIRNISKLIGRVLQSLRNNLAHTQDIVPHDWPQIARLAKHFAKILCR